MFHTEMAIEAWDRCENSNDVSNVSGLTPEAWEDFDKIKAGPILRQGSRLRDGSSVVHIQIDGGNITVFLSQREDGLIEVTRQCRQ